MKIFRRLTAAICALALSCSLAAAQVQTGTIYNPSPLQVRDDRAIGQSGIPFILPSNGLMVANGVGTLGVALGVTYPNAYMWFAANAIATGVPAGWYYAIFSSTTAFVVYNNTYVSGTPTIPASPTPFVTVSPATYTGATTANAYTLSIAGNTIGANGAVRVSTASSYTNTSANKATAIYFGTSGAVEFAGFIGTTTVAGGVAVGGFRNRGVTNSQVALGAIPGSGTSGTAIAMGSFDTTSAQNLIIQITNPTPATNNNVLEQVTVELLPGVP